ncbi:hypothetical protein CW304_19590 [Bacillus sp. UFRGS-B20]|nr:hypothetical protein CW304_19590 [Bacillus sp. UFRGS-B20]
MYFACYIYYEGHFNFSPQEFKNIYWGIVFGGRECCKHIIITRLFIRPHRRLTRRYVIRGPGSIFEIKEQTFGFTKTTRYFSLRYFACLIISSRRVLQGVFESNTTCSTYL